MPHRSLPRRFIELAERRFTRHPMVKKVLLPTPHTQVELSSQGNSVNIDGIFVFDHARGQGEASQALRALTALADELGVACSVTPQPFGADGLTAEHLASWYRRHGFIADSDSDDEERLVRHPRVVSAAGG